MAYLDVSDAKGNLDDHTLENVTTRAGLRGLRHYTIQGRLKYNCSLLVSIRTYLRRFVFCFIYMSFVNITDSFWLPFKNYFAKRSFV